MPLRSPYLASAAPSVLCSALAISCWSSCGGEAYQPDEQGSAAATSDTLLVDDSLIQESADRAPMHEEVGIGSIELPGPPPSDLRCSLPGGRWDELVIGGIPGIDWIEAFGPPSVVEGPGARWLEASGAPEATLTGNLLLHFEQEEGGVIELRGNDVTLGPATVQVEHARLRLHTQPAPFAIEGYINTSAEAPLPISGRGWACTRVLIP